MAFFWYNVSGGGLFPAEQAAVDWIASQPIGQLVRVQTKEPRNAEAHRAFMATMDTVHEHLPERLARYWPTRKAMLDFLKIRAGYRETILDLAGDVIGFKADSTSFDAMDEPTFQALAQDVYDLIAAEIVPELDSEEWRQEIVARITRRGR